MIPILKICNRCKLEKEITLFPKAPTCKDGYRNYCKVCQKISKDSWRIKNKEHHNFKCREWTRLNPEKSKEMKWNWRVKNSDYQKTYKKIYGKLHKLSININTSMRRRKIRLASPQWADRKVIKDFYLAANYFGLEVDHIIPISHPAVCGLHVPDNMQLLSKSNNSSKGNYFAVG